VNDIDVVLGLLVVVATLATVARRIGVPSPILMVLGGIAIGFIPGLPAVELRPDVVFVVFLPRCSTSPRSSRRSRITRRTPGRSDCWPSGSSLRPQPR
jgi:hypothetical protein